MPLLSNFPNYFFPLRLLVSFVPIYMYIYNACKVCMQMCVNKIRYIYIYICVCVCVCVCVRACVRARVCVECLMFSSDVLTRLS